MLTGVPLCSSLIIVYMHHCFLMQNIIYIHSETTSFDPISFIKRIPLASYFNNEYYYNSMEKTKTKLYSHHFTFHFLHRSQKHVCIIHHMRYFSRLFRSDMITKNKKVLIHSTHILRNWLCGCTTKWFSIVIFSYLSTEKEEL